MKAGKAEVIAVCAGVLALAAAFITSRTSTGSTSTFVSSALLNVGSALVLIGVLVRVERQIANRLDENARATAELRAQVEDVTEAFRRAMPGALEGQPLSSEPERFGPEARSTSSLRSKWLGRARARIRFPAQTMGRSRVLPPVVGALLIGAIAIAASRSFPDAGDDGVLPILTSAREAGYRVVTLPHAPDELAFDRDAVWINTGRKIRKFDLRSNRPISPTISLPAGPARMGVGSGALWVGVAEVGPRGYFGSLVSISLRTGRPLRPTIRLNEWPARVLVSKGTVLVLTEPVIHNEDDPPPFHLLRFDAATGRLKTRRTLRLGILHEAALVGGQLWLVSDRRRRIYRLDPRTGRTAAPPIRTREFPMLATSPSMVALAADDNIVRELKPDTGRTQADLGVPDTVYRLAAGKRYAWIAFIGGGVQALDLRSGSTATAVMANGDHPFEVWIGGGSVWLGDNFSSRLFRLTPRRGQP